MFTDQEEEQLQEFYAMAPDPESVISPEELHGLLFGLAITPEDLEPSEWFEDLFGDCPPTFAEAGSREKILGYLQEMVKRRKEWNHAGELSFPFDYDQMEDEDMDLLFDWAYGLFAALALRPDLWKLQALKSNKALLLETGVDPRPDDLLTLGVSIIAAAAFPEEVESMVVEEESKEVKKGKKKQKEPEEDILSLVINTMPYAVTILQEYAETKSSRVH